MIDDDIPEPLRLAKELRMAAGELETLHALGRLMLSAG